MAQFLSSRATSFLDKCPLHGVSVPSIPDVAIFLSNRRHAFLSKYAASFCKDCSSNGKPLVNDAIKFSYTYQQSVPKPEGTHATTRLQPIANLTSSFLSRNGLNERVCTVSFIPREGDFACAKECRNSFNNCVSSPDRNTTDSNHLKGDQSEAMLHALTYRDSFIELTFPFSTNPSLREAFRRADDARVMRWGLLLELLDALAGDIAYRHCDPTGRYVDNSLYTIVTLSIDEMILAKPNKLLDIVDNPRSKKVPFEKKAKKLTNENNANLKPNLPLYSNICKTISLEKNLLLRGFTTFVGKSSLEVRIEMLQVKEIEILHNRWLNSLPSRGDNFFRLSGNVVTEETNCKYISMKDTLLKSIILMQHDKRNVHYKIFGGYIARKAFELSWLTAQSFLRTTHPRLQAIDKINFLKPVEIGSMIQMEAKVVFTFLKDIQIMVEAFQIDPILGKTTKTNHFCFSYRQEDDIDGLGAIEVVPGEYDECIQFLSARRRYLYRLGSEETRK
ncbi:hypothetical protein IE077_002796 [Cardiosporidium cionae]|uniref:HotDog ACOT-type domain-containing protein n=1 Tax=Cardiosporidium cionae TaxID=476202 RepID=A0ABQ7JFU5_9APIC|nr:hypothetical protein IE077_002796 [Cardiosporidium cionae]|eukprot:KAF8822750.1 hypothetical protein IE077_002796 [Cardiosporidium cionae]